MLGSCSRFGEGGLIINKIRCPKCKVLKLSKQFNKDNTKKNGFQSWCRKCDRVGYVAYREKVKTHIKGIRSLGCEKCNESDPCCIDFHHIDPSTKTIEIAFAARNGWSIDSIDSEIDKCVRLCANCHRKHHFYGGTL